MRWYSIRLYDPITGAMTERWDSHDQNERAIKGALQVDFNLPVAPCTIPTGAGTLTVWGLPMDKISGAADYHNKKIKIFGGMAKGLPLAGDRNGLLATGQIMDSFGNWQGVDMNIMFTIIPATGEVSAPSNIVLNANEGETVQEATTRALKVAYDGRAVDAINLPQDLKFNRQTVGYYHSLSEFAKAISEISKEILQSPTYSGLKILDNGEKFTLFDNSAIQHETPIKITSLEMIGQPTWIEKLKVQFKVVMRNDIEVGQYVELPAFFGFSQNKAGGFIRNGATFSGVFVVETVVHTGSSRSADANAWVSVFTAVPIGTRTTQ